MIVIDDKSKCVGCSACVQCCPVHCISLHKDLEGFNYPLVDNSVCINCHKCENVCPVINNEKQSIRKNPDIFCTRNLDEKIRSQSSSGGVFTTLAQYILNNDGVVFGAALSSDCQSVKHIGVETIYDLKKLQGSKYVQSDIDMSYLEVKKQLKLGRYVLFTGTPCQIKGLKLFLKKEYDNLICVDLICHGVPSQKFFSKYIDYLQNIHKDKLINVSFRSKDYGWTNFGMKYTFKNKKQIFKFNFEDPYFIIFNSSISLRPSCYDCPVKNNNSGSDITLGDFWTTKYIDDTLNDEKGLSIVMVNTPKGNLIFNKIKSYFYVYEKEISYDLAVKCNHAISSSQPYSNVRTRFYEDLDRISFDCIISKYAPLSKKAHLKAFLIRIHIYQFIQILRNRIFSNHIL